MDDLSTLRRHAVRAWLLNNLAFVDTLLSAQTGVEVLEGVAKLADGLDEVGSGRLVAASPDDGESLGDMRAISRLVQALDALAPPEEPPSGPRLVE